MKKSCTSIAILYCFLAALLISCEKDCNITGKASLKLNFYPSVGSNQLVYNQEYTVNGRKLKFTKAQFYVSGIRLKNEDNALITPEMMYALVHAGETNYTANAIDQGKYQLLEFNVGVDSAANHGDPVQWGATHPLYVNGINSSYWDWSQGYVFMKLEGYVDTSAAANGNATTGFAYHTGNNEMLRLVSLSIDKDICSNEASIELNVDYAKLLEDVDFRTELQTHSTGSKPLAKKIADKVQEAITLK